MQPILFYLLSSTAIPYQSHLVCLPLLPFLPPPNCETNVPSSSSSSLFLFPHTQSLPPSPFPLSPCWMDYCDCFHPAFRRRPPDPTVLTLLPPLTQRKRQVREGRPSTRCFHCIRHSYIFGAQKSLIFHRWAEGINSFAIGVHDEKLESNSLSPLRLGKSTSIVSPPFRAWKTNLFWCFRAL